MIEIVFKNGDLIKWNKSEYTEYDMKGNFFIVINGSQWVGMYALDAILSVEVRGE